MGFFNKKEVNKSKTIIWYEEIEKAYKDVTRKTFKFSCMELTGELFIITINNKLIYSYKKYEENDITEVINIDEILKVDLNVITKNKTVVKYFTLVPTFDTVCDIDYIELKIITLDKIYRTKINYIGYSKENKNNFDQLEILNAYLERKIKNNIF